MQGYFANGQPYIDIEVSGSNPASPTRLQAVVDTGFSGFLLLPILNAFPIGLILDSITEITLADGSAHNKLVCRGNIHFASQTHTGLILIEEQETDILVGLEFLQTFQLRLTLDTTNQTLDLTATG